MIVEACVESLDEALAAARGGADRLELCARMDAGGTTPSEALFRVVREQVPLPIAMMVRPRGGSFHYSPAELDVLRRDLDAALALGADMVVLGLLEANGVLSARFTRELVLRAGKTPVTFHKAFDVVADQLDALEALVDAGVSRVLTSGGAATAHDGIAMLARLVERSDGRIAIMAGGNVRGPNVREVVERSGVREVHARCIHDAVIRDIVGALRVR